MQFTKFSIKMSILSFLSTILFIFPEIFSLYSGKSYVIELTPANFQKEIMESDKVCLVLYYSQNCLHCEQLKPVYEEVALTLQSVAKIGALNVEKYVEFSKNFNLRVYPTLRIFSADKNNSPEDFFGPRTHAKITEAVLKEIKHTMYRKLSPKNLFRFEGVTFWHEKNFSRLQNSIDIWVVAFYIPWYDLCVELSPKWKILSKEFDGKIRFGAIEATTNKGLTRYFGINSYPTIVLFPKLDKIKNLEIYSGALTPEAIEDWIETQVGVKKPPKIQQITKNVFENPKTTNWVISFLPNLNDCQSPCRKKYLQTLTSLSNDFKSNYWNWAWVEQGSQRSLESTFFTNLKDLRFPNLVVVNLKQKGFAVLKENFDKKKIKEFLVKFANEKLRFSEFDKIIKLDKIQPWRDEL